MIERGLLQRVLKVLVVVGMSCMLMYSDARASVDITKAVIHHTASHDVSVAEIRSWHLQRGWSDIGYHFIIRKNGSVESGRSLDRQGAHARGRNHYVGIALTGYNKFTGMQIESLKRLLVELGVTHIERHHEECPGRGIDIERIEVEVETENRN